ncbi:glycosyltransferase family 2 protein [Rhizobium tubonense]|uniref:Glycosyl transferase n=1 Tax=Rhizobium tubonense TaxID=484088 RepID=A0A2W4CBC2_9HYPH|nr:glycosyltransferase family 2 protein [Rhizobium tubonense]PZM10602.1 glycosyl transferase [Rhizobium tubonense]
MTEFTPDVSFIIPAYNAAATLERAIDSALAQGGVSMEVIVVDDCSKDDTRALVENHADPRVRLIALARNGGPGVARNFGIQAARGRWIAVLDSDDILRPDRMARMVDKAEKAGANIAVDNLDVVTSEGQYKGTMFNSDKLARMTELGLADFIASNVLFRNVHNFGYMKPVFERSFLMDKDVRFDPLLRIGEDYIFLASALAKGGVCIVDPTPGYVYYVNEGSISRVLELKHVEAMMAADDRFLAAHQLDGAALAAQRRRTRNLKQAHSFLMLVQNIKDRSLGATLMIACRSPRAVWLLKWPIMMRLERLIAFFRRDQHAATSQAAKLPALGGGPHSNKG